MSGQSRMEGGAVVRDSHGGEGCARACTCGMCWVLGQWAGEGGREGGVRRGCKTEEGRGVGPPGVAVLLGLVAPSGLGGGAAHSSLACSLAPSK